MATLRFSVNWRRADVLTLRRRSVGVLASLAASVVSMATMATPSFAAIADFGSSGLAGGGQVNAVALAAGSTCTGTDSTGMTTHDLLSGGDVFGADVSTDAAQSWAPQNQGITNPDLISMSAVAYEPIGPDASNAEAYALAGRKRRLGWGAAGGW